MTRTTERVPQRAAIWWANAAFFVSIHVLAIVGVYIHPPPSRSAEALVSSSRHRARWRSIALCASSYQLAMFGITIGYHRLWSHRSFVAKRPLRIVLMLLGTMGCQGSIKWWCSRHRLHHRYTDDPVDDPYAATLGLFHSHMGWIFRKPVYKKMNFVDRTDLDADPVARWQHEHYTGLTLAMCFVLPTILGAVWGDAKGGLIYGGFVARVIIWHCTFLVNSFAHWEGLQPYSDEMTARGNLIMAILTAGEGNHNFHHAFPRDYRAGPHRLSWDPSKWVIDLLASFTPLVPNRRITSDDELQEAVADMVKRGPGYAHPHHHDDNDFSDLSSRLGDVTEEFELLPIWNSARIDAYLSHSTEDDIPLRKDTCSASRKRVLFLHGCVVDVSSYATEHLTQCALVFSSRFRPVQPGGFSVLKPYFAEVSSSGGSSWRDATHTFDGGMNKHSRMARRRLASLRLARIGEDVILSE